jgi:DNA-binding response OmpR family regulator
LGNNRKILIIDDEVAIRRVVALKLRNHGYEVITAKNGEEGLELIETQKPQVVITDLNMPKMDGKALCEKSRGLKKDYNFLTIIISCQIPSAEHRWINDMENTQFMPKPFSPSQLVSCIDRYFDN